MNDWHMRYRIPAIICAAFLMCGFIMGCSMGKSTVLKPPSQPLGTFGTVEVKTFRVDLKVLEELDDEDKVEAEQFIEQISQQLSNDLESQKLFLSGKEPSLIIEGNVIEYDLGSVAARLALGFVGDGKIIVDVTYQTYDGVVIAQQTVESVISAGGFGRALKDATTRIVDTIVKFVKEHHGEKI